MAVCVPGYVRPYRSSAAIELMIPRGADVQYGLLGGTYYATSDDRLVLRAATIDEDVAGCGLEYRDSLVRSLETPRVGLPRHLAEGAISGLKSWFSVQGSLSPGILSLDCAAFGSVGSSSVVFGHLASLLVSVMMAQEISPMLLDGVLEDLL
ncbi:hypothetical protein EDC02_1093 [Micromonospora sp. Llam0]|nr:hypothetical protein EDC02_1093 [Micromonospora sp. Llam0]